MMRKTVHVLPLVSEETKREVIKKFVAMMAEPYRGSDASLIPMVKKLLKKKEHILKAVARHGTPCYLLDENELSQSITVFQDAMKKKVPDIDIYYAVKVNDHPYVLKRVVRAGLGLDVSSERELRMALAHKAKKIVFTGPAKTQSSLVLALTRADRVIINIDSFRELELLGELSTRMRRTIRAGVRVIGTGASWSKFGIEINELRAFFDAATLHPYVALTGIHTHMSWNSDATPYAVLFKEVATYLAQNFSTEELQKITFFDFGGGFVPDRVEGEYPHYSPQGTAINAVYEHFSEKAPFLRRHHTYESVPISEYAQGIGRAIDTHLRPLLPGARYLTEPGRIIANNAMHVVLRIVDIKKNGSIIVDGGMNMIGWERFELEYFPVINLTHPSLTESPALVYGSLCMMQDVWSYYCYASRMEVGDILLVPYQGALTYSLAQEFIHGKPTVYRLNTSRNPQKRTS